LREQYWVSLGYELTEGHHTEGLFCRAAAINTAASLAGDWDVALIADADVFVPPQQLSRAVVRAAQSPALVLAHDEWLSLDEETTADVLAGRQPPLVPAARRRSPVSGVLAIGRATWDRVGGFDERFEGYGWEDRAFVRKCTLAAGFSRVPGPMWHLWHEPVTPNVTGPEWRRAFALWRTYETARSLRELVRR